MRFEINNRERSFDDPFIVNPDNFYMPQLGRGAIEKLLASVKVAKYITPKNMYQLLSTATETYTYESLMEPYNNGIGRFEPERMIGLSVSIDPYDYISEHLPFIKPSFFLELHRIPAHFINGDEVQRKEVASAIKIDEFKQAKTTTIHSFLRNKNGEVKYKQKYIVIDGKTKFWKDMPVSEPLRSLGFMELCRQIQYLQEDRPTPLDLSTY